MQGLLLKYVFRHFSFSWVREFFPQSDLILCLPPHLAVGCGGETAVEGARSEETRAEPGRLP